MNFSDIFGKAFAFILSVSILITPFTATAQTQVKVPKNKYKVEEDLKLGRETAAEVEKKFPVLNDSEATGYLQSVGRRLVEAVPQQFQQPAFQYNFKIINASDINAFALPGGPMYVNRGMIEAAKNEGEMAGVMAHEIAHVALRHGTAQATNRNSGWNRALGIGAILGGAVLGGETGASIGAALYTGFFLLPYSREQETQADILGAQILAQADYDPNDLANMFRTIEKTSGGGGGPDWFSTHPAPAKRYERIAQEASMLDVSKYPIKKTMGFERTQRNLSALPKTKTLAEFEKAADKNRPTPGGQTGGGYKDRVDLPYPGTRDVRNGNWLYVQIPRNWRDFSDRDSIELAPDGAHGDKGITHGMIIGIYRSRQSDVYYASQEYLDEVLRRNTYLRKRTNLDRTSISGQTGYEIELRGTSPITGRTEVVTVYTTELRDRDICYMITVVPENERYYYRSAFKNVLESVRLYY